MQRGPKVRIYDVQRTKTGAPAEPVSDALAVEEPLEISLDGVPLAVLMRTPGDDAALAAGFLITEGIVGGCEEIGEIREIEGTDAVEDREGNVEDEVANRIDVKLAPGVEIDREKLTRNFYSSSSCGVCGKASIEAVNLKAAPLVGRWKVSPALILSLPLKLRERQRAFEQTGALHAAGLFDLEGNLTQVAEDIGRHNAVDKVIGAAAMDDRLPLDKTILAVSGRIGFEIAQKALLAGIPCIAAISGASSLSVDLAVDQGMTMIGFVRGDSMTVYHGGWRLESS